MLYALTLTRNKRENFEKDTQAIKICLDEICKSYEVGYLGWELTKEEPHRLHVHCTISGPRMPYMQKHTKLLNKYFMNSNVQKLKEMKDIEKWVSYTHKFTQSIHDAYEESIFPSLVKKTGLNKNFVYPEIKNVLKKNEYPPNFVFNPKTKEQTYLESFNLLKKKATA